MNNKFMAKAAAGNRKFMVQAAESRSKLIGAILCGALFICGVFLGTYSVNLLGEDAIQNLSGYYSGYLELVRGGQAAAPNFWTSLVSVYRLPCIVFLLAFFLPGPICILGLSGFRGFLLSFSIATVVRTFGIGGWKLAFTVFGLSALITVPCFFILCIQSFSASLELFRGAVGTGKREVIYTRRFFFRGGICAFVLMIAAVLETYLVPALVALLA